MDKPVLKRNVGRLPAILLVISGIIGSGVFKKIAPMADGLHSPKWILICWAAAGLLSLAGALSNAELASMMAACGGEYAYFRRIYGKLFSFLFGWANLTVMKAATIAALAYIFAQSFNSVYPLPELSISGLGPIGENVSIKLLASALIAGLSYVNHRGVVLGEKLSRWLTVSIIVAICGFVALALASGKGSATHLRTEGVVPEGWQLLTVFFAAMVSAFWGYEGWNNIGYIGEEIREPQKNIPLALGIGTVVVIVLYLLANTVYLYILPVDKLAAFYHAGNTIAAVEVARVISGGTGALVLSCLILLTTFCCTNSTILMAARISYAMARDGLFLRGAGEIHARYGTPSKAIRWQAVWSIVLLWSGDFDQLTDLLIFASFIFYGATSLGVIVMRRREPDAVRPYKVPGYPLLPAIFALFCCMLVVITLVKAPARSLTGLGLICAGIPVYLYYTRRKKRAD